MMKFYEFLKSPGCKAFTRKALSALVAIALASGVALHAGTSGQQQRKERIDISLRNATLEQVLLHVQNASGYYVLFNSTEAKAITGLNIDLRNTTVADVLGAALRNTNMGYTIEDDTIVVKANSRQGQNATGNNQPGARVTVTGIVKQTSGEPLVGATVIIEGSSSGTTTDVNGRFSLSFVPGTGTTIVVSFIGMETRRIAYTGQTRLEVTLSETAQSIQDVVVTGYADININKTASNVTVMRGEDLARVSPTSVLSAISAFEPSFRLKENLVDGANPNVLPEFTIRGETALNPDIADDVSRTSLLSSRNLPIFLVDGFEVDVERIYDMDPNRIESLTILKDASAAALYGSRAGNGIIVIVTKAVRPGKVNVDYNVTTTLHVPDLRSYDLMDAREKVEAERAAGLYDITTGSSMEMMQYEYYRRILAYIDTGVDTDWLAQGVRNIVNHRHDVNITGGENSLRWGANVNYNSGNGIMKGSERNTYSGEFSLQVRIGNFLLTNVARYGGQQGSESPFGSFSDYSHKQPYDKLYDPETGDYVQFVESWGRSLTNSQLLNPLFEAEAYNSYTKSKYDQYSDLMRLRWDISPRFHITGSFNIDKKYTENSTFIDPNSYIFNGQTPTDPNLRGSLSLTEREVLSTEGRLQLSYNNQWGDHFIAVTANGTVKQDKASQTTYNYTGFATGKVSTVNAAARITSKPSNRNQKARSASLSFYGNYSYKEIYLIDLTFALDGNAEFGSKNKTAPFWSVAGGVQFHNYEFFRSRIIDRLVLRGSYGLLGRVPMTQSASTNIYQNISQDDWYITGTGSALKAMGNPELKWEQTWVTDLSAEIQMWQNRLYFKVGYYNKITDGQLAEVGISSSSGFTYFWDNMGKVKNEGVELDFHVEPLRSNDWNLRIGAKLRHNRNKILELSEAAKAYNTLVDEYFETYFGVNGLNMKKAEYGVPYRKFYEGASTTSIAAVHSLGINPGNGQEVYRRPDGTISYEWRSVDQVVAGDTEPDVSGTINISLRWKQFDLLTSLYFEFGGQAYNSTLMQYVENVNLRTQNADRRVNLLRWKEPGDLTPLKSITDRELVTRPTTRFVQDRNIFRSMSLDVGYTFDRDLIRKIGLGNVRVSFNTGELFYLSNVKRERGTSYPYERTYALKAQISF